VIELQGDFDGDSNEAFKNAITEIIAAQKVSIVLDMSGVGFIDSIGLEQLLWMRDYCRQNRCELRLAALDENCAKILEITRIENEFDRYSGLAEAVKSFA
jgi:anti-sigma B factor antagonist